MSRFARVWPRSLRSQMRLILFLIGIVVVLQAVAVVGLSQWSSAAYAKEDRAQDLQQSLLRLGQQMADQDHWLHAYEATGDPTFLTNYLQSATAVRQTAATLPANDDRMTRASVTGLVQAVDAWRASADATVAEVKASGPINDASPMGGQEAGLYAAAKAAANKAEAAADARIQHELGLARGAQAAQNIGIASGLLMSLVLLALVGSVYSRSTIRPMRGLIESARRLALGQPAEVKGLARLDEVGQLARALAAWRQLADQREEIARLMLEVSAKVERQEILTLAGDRLRHLLGAEQVVIALRAGARHEIAWAAPAPFNASTRLLELLPRSATLAAGKPVLVDGPSESWGEEFTAWANANDLGPAMVMPLISTGRLLGIAAVLRRAGAHPFDEVDAQRGELLVPQIAAALHVAALFGDVQEANQALQVASRHKSQFLANMSHELRTPLNSILGFSQMLLDYPEMAENADRRSRYLNNITSSGRHLLELINDVLDLSKVEAGRVELTRERAPIGEAFDAVLASVQPLAKAKDIKLVRSLPEPIAIDADRTRFVQILFNLVSNAIKFTPEGGQVGLAARRDGAWAVVEITDTGIGIAKEDQARIFSEFEQLEAGRAKGRQGTGLGLALTKRLVELHDGVIELESEVDKGSTFRLRMPVYDHQRQDELAREFSANTGPLVLVVDDEAAAARLLADHLGHAGYRIAWARSPEDALEQARALRPAAITLDILLPELQGWDLLRDLGQDPATARIPVVVVSVLEDRSRALASGAVDLLTKPAEARAILAGLERAIAGTGTLAS